MGSGNWKAAVVTMVLACAGVGAAAAQEVPTAQSPAVQHFLAYRAAFDRRDFSGAEAEAVLALQAAEAANSARVGVLAFNLASLRIVWLHKYAEAFAPAQRAFTAGGPGVIPAQAQVFVVLAQLPTRADAAAEAQPLIAAMTYDRRFQYDAAQALGYWAASTRRFSVAETAYAQAVAAAETFGAEGALDLVRSLTDLGATQLKAKRYDAAGVTLSRAVTTGAPLAPETSGPAPSYAEVIYYNAFGWAGALRSTLM